jgi:hypothetical protein
MELYDWLLVILSYEIIEYLNSFVEYYIGLAFYFYYYDYGSINI